MKANAIMINPKDNVATVMNGAKKGDTINYFNVQEMLSLVARQDIPACNKIALAPIAKGSHVIKYGECIGGALVDINKGCLVSHLNIESLPRDYESELEE